MYIFTGPSALSLNVIKNSKLLSVDIQWDAVDDSLTTNYTIQWTRAGDDIQAATLIEQTSYMINGLTLDTVYAISVFAVNRCGTGPGSIASVSFPTGMHLPYLYVLLVHVIVKVKYYILCIALSNGRE